MVNEKLKKSYKIPDNFEELSTFQIDLKLDKFCFSFGNIYKTRLYKFEFEDQKDSTPEDVKCLIAF